MFYLYNAQEGYWFGYATIRPGQGAHAEAQRSYAAVKNTVYWNMADYVRR
ncbi:MAG: hypothetical protein K2I92_06225 [Muribaculaceae bacterium]|nr:hypothetical protein [Muribaculaceae bacterium]